jgi:RNA polymerase-binding transcription factor DksA
MRTSEIRRLEIYLEFHHDQLLEKLRSDHDADSDAPSIRNSKYGSATRFVRDWLLRSCEQIESALARIQKGTYGKCVSCGNEIGLQVLEVVPWAQFCIPCQDESDQRQESENRFFSSQARVI